jgi:hypothetical protein
MSQRVRNVLVGAGVVTAILLVAGWDPVLRLAACLAVNLLAFGLVIRFILRFNTSDERQMLRSVWLSMLTVTLATYVPFVWLLAYPVLLLALGGPWIPGFIASQILIGRGLGPLVGPFVWTILILSFFTWLSRHGARMRAIATWCALASSLFQSAAIAFVVTHFHT